MAPNAQQTLKKTYLQTSLAICFGNVNVYVRHTIGNIQYGTQTWGSIDPCMRMATVLEGKRRPRAIISINESFDRG